MHCIFNIPTLAFKSQIMCH